MNADTILEKKKVVDILEPTKYKVIVCNDDVTPMDFVIALLMSVFRHSQSEAERLTLTVHNNGSAVVGIYPYEIAEQKSVDGINLARSHGFPLILKVAPE